MRLFVGVALPEPVAARLAAWAAPLGGRPLAPEALHVTLFFLGERPDPGPLRAALHELPRERLVLVPGRAVRLARVLAIEMADPTGGLGRLHARGFPTWTPEARRLRPHVTVLRRPPEGLRPPPPPRLAPFRAPALVLYRSHPGSRYEAIERIDL